MKTLKVKVKPADAVEKADGAFRLKPDSRQTDDLAVLAKSGLKLDDLAGVMGHLLDRVKALEENR